MSFQIKKSIFHFFLFRFTKYFWHDKYRFPHVIFEIRTTENRACIWHVKTPRMTVNYKKAFSQSHIRKIADKNDMQHKTRNACNYAYLFVWNFLMITEKKMNISKINLTLRHFRMTLAILWVKISLCSDILHLLRFFVILLKSNP